MAPDLALSSSLGTIGFDLQRSDWIEQWTLPLGICLSERVGSKVDLSIGTRGALWACQGLLDLPLIEASLMLECVMHLLTPGVWYMVPSFEV